MAEEHEIEELEAGDEIAWECPGCGTTSTKPLGKGITMSLLSTGAVSFPCSVCKETVKVGIERIEPVRGGERTEYDPTDVYNA